MKSVLTPSTQKALVDLQLLYPEMSPDRIVNYVLQLHWCKNLHRLEALRPERQPYYQNFFQEDKSEKSHNPGVGGPANSHRGNIPGCHVT